MVFWGKKVKDERAASEKPAPKKLIIIDERSRDLSALKTRFRDLGYDVTAVLALDTQYADLNLVDESLRINTNKAMNEVARAGTKGYEHFPRFIVSADRAIYSLNQLQQLLEQIQPDYVLSANRFLRARGLETGDHVMHHVEHIWPKAARVVHTKNDIGAVRMPVLVKDAASTGKFALVSQTDDSGRFYADRIFKEIEKARAHTKA